MTEYGTILMEAYCTFRADEYFKERTYLNNKTYRRVFEAAFQYGWEAPGDASEGVIERAKKLGVATVPVSDVLDELERLRAALSAAQNPECAAFQLGWEAHRDVSTSKLEGEIEMTISAEYRVKTSNGASIHIVNNHLQLQVNQMIVWMLNHPEFALGMVPKWNELKADQQAFADHAKDSAVE